MNMDIRSLVIVPGGLGYWVHPQSRRDVREIAGCADGVYLYATPHELNPWNLNDIAVLSDAMKAIHDAGLQVILATDFGGTFAMCSKAGVYSPMRVRMRQIHWDGREREEACVNNPEFIKRSSEYYNWVLDNFEIDWLNYDEPTSYALQYRCVCKYCRDRFGGAFSEAETEKHADIYAQCFIEYLDRLGAIAKARGKKVSAVCYEKYPYFHERLLMLDTLDMVGPDPYWFKPWMNNGTPNDVFEPTKMFRDMCRKYKKQCCVVIQGFKVPAGREDEIYESGRIAAGVGVDCMIGWFYWRGTANPEKAWATTFKMLRDFREGALCV